MGGIKMNLKDKKILLVGLAKTGVSTIKHLDKLGANIIVNDIKNKETLSEILKELDDLSNVEYILGYHPENVDDIDMAVVSPGVPLDLPFILKLKSKDIEIIGEVELAYRLSNKPMFIGITGTNGKTTTTSLVGEIFKEANVDTYIVGNIGNPVIDTVGIANEKSVLVTELSSFQLESIDTFKPKVSAILNFTEDHLNRHHTMQNYIEAKARILMNQNSEDFCILNYDDEKVRELSDKVKAKKIFFSRKKQLEEGIYLDTDNNIVIDINDKIVLLNKEELSLPGNHNLENCMAAIGISYVSNVDIEVIKGVLKTFAAVEHRQEFVRNLNGIMFVNDSKGTNPDSTIKAIQSYKRPIILIAGGIDKQSDFNELLEVAKENVKALVLLGETAPKIESIAKEKGFERIYKVKNMKEAVNTSYEIADKEDVVLLSPACASWDMYKSFEVRGNDFKDNVHNLK
jgi:UDP-N-acetylmuramoylalanine--D-glutamate ligase